MDIQAVEDSMTQAVTLCDIQRKVPAGSLVSIPDEPFYHDSSIGLVRFKWRDDIYSVPERMLKVVDDEEV